MSRLPLPFILPMAAILFIVVWGGGLGAAFIFVAKTDIGTWGAVIIGLALVIGVPTLAALMTMPKR